MKGTELENVVWRDRHVVRNANEDIQLLHSLKKGGISDERKQNYLYCFMYGVKCWFL